MLLNGAPYVAITGVLTREVERGTAGIGFLLGVALFTIVPTIVEIGAVVAIMVSRYSDWFTTVIAATFAGYTVFTLVFTQRRAIHQRAQNELDSTANDCSRPSNGPLRRPWSSGAPR